MNRSGIRKTNLSNKDISTSPTMTAMTFSDSKSIDQTRSVRRRRRYRATRKKTLGLATPVTTMSSGDVTLGMESQGCHAGNKACQEPESHPHMDEGLEAKGRESRNESGAKVASLQKRRSRSKSEVH